MIVYDLRCANSHTFEGWFNDLASFEEQKERKLIRCPVCGSHDISIIPSTVKCVGKSSPAEDDSPHRNVTYRRVIEEVTRYINTHCEDVGDQFAEVALKIHRNEEERRNIKGTTTEDEEQELTAEGVEFLKVPVIKYDS